MPTLIYESTCPICGDMHSVRSRTSASETKPGADDLRVGSNLDVERDLAEHRNYVRINLAPAVGPLVFLEDGPVLHGQRLWTEVTHDSGKIIGLRLVRATSSLLKRLHYIAPRSRTVFWDWSDDLFDPRSLNDDVDTNDEVRALRLKLMLLEPLPARTFDEAKLATTTFGLEAAGAFERIEETRRWRLPCKTAYTEVVLEFTIDDETDTDRVRFGPGRSNIIPPDVFRYRAIATADATPANLLELDPSGIEVVRKALELTLEYLAQLRAFIPDGELLVPVDDFIGDVPRAIRLEHPHRYALLSLETEMRIWRHDLQSLGVTRALPARSVEEADIFMRLHPCPVCTASTPQLPSSIVARGEDLVSLYTGNCPTCSTVRRFAFLLDEDPPLNTEDNFDFGRGRSPLLDPGQWLAAADMFAKQVPANLSQLDEATRRRSNYRLLLAITAIDEVIKFIDEGAASVAESAFTTRMGWSVYATEPGRFQRKRLVAVWDAYHQIRNGIEFH